MAKVEGLERADQGHDPLFMAHQLLCETVLQEFLESERQRGLAASTIYSRHKILKNLPGFDPATVATYARERGLRPGSHSHLAKTARYYCAWAEEELGVKSPWRPNTVMPKVPASQGDPLSDNEVFALAKTPAWDFCVLGLYAGLRSCEIAAFQTEQVFHTAAGPQLRVVGKGGKDATIPCHREVEQLVARHDVPGSLWPDLSTQALQKRVAYWFRKVGIQRGGIHRTRATFATRLYASCGDLVVVQNALRHSSLATTQAYLGLDRDRFQTAVAAL